MHEVKHIMLQIRSQLDLAGLGDDVFRRKLRTSSIGSDISEVMLASPDGTKHILTSFEHYQYPHQYFANLQRNILSYVCKQLGLPEGAPLQIGNNLMVCACLLYRFTLVKC
jgi:hypothetical protein